MRSKVLCFVITAISLSTFFFNPPLLFADCVLCVCQTDNTCSAITDCAATTNCSSTTFTPSCTVSYTLSAKTACPSGYDCGKCWACVNIYNGATPVANCHNTHCDTGECFYSCNANLTANVTYTLYVCLGGCAGGPCGESCGTGCTATGCVSYSVISCP